MLNAIFGGNHLVCKEFLRDIYILCNTKLFLKYGHYDDKSISILRFLLPRPKTFVAFIVMVPNSNATDRQMMSIGTIS
jgi:hypothetical protein